MALGLDGWVADTDVHTEGKVAGAHTPATAPREISTDAAICDDCPPETYALVTRPIPGARS